MALEEKPTLDPQAVSMTPKERMAMLQGMLKKKPAPSL
jgi:hypothetical protein